MPRFCLPLLLLLVTWMPCGWASSVVFLNPGHADEPFWRTYSQFMQAAATDLGLHLEVVYAGRNKQRMLQQAHELRTRTPQPDYLLFTNEEYVGPELLRLFADSPSRLFALHSTLTADQQARTGASREKHANWIGSLVVNDQQAGALMAEGLLALHATPAPIEMLAFSGARNTPSATLREAGLQAVLQTHPKVQLRQLVYGEWNRQRAYEQALSLLQRYPQVSHVWSANDEMAFGVLQAARELGRQPGRDLHLTGLNNSTALFQAYRAGDIEVLVTGHFTLGAWALVMLHDHAKGLDFADYGGKDQVAKLFRQVSAAQSLRLEQRLSQPGQGIDFRRYSRQANPRLRAYRFSIDALLR